MDNKPNMFEEGIFELVQLGANHRFNQISFARIQTLDSQHCSYDIVINTLDTRSFRYKDRPHIGITFKPFKYSDYIIYILSMITKYLAKNQSTIYFTHYTKSLMWHSLVFDNREFSSKVFDPDIVKTGFLSVTCKSNHEILTNLETFEMRIKIHE